jgi:2-haloacid dehalogenase
MTDTEVLARSRRALIAGLAASAAFPLASKSTAAAQAPIVQAIAFDAFPIFDPRPITTLAQSLLGEQGKRLASAWSTRLFGYTWLTTAANRYEAFAVLADRALVTSAGSLGLSLSARDREQLTAAYAHLDVWPDVKPALAGLRDAGVRLVFLSNLGEAALQDNMGRAGIDGLFEAVLSTDRVRQFKPSPAAYRMAMDALGLPKPAIGFAAFAGWDATGASWFGYRTAWINRLSAQAEGLDGTPAVVSQGMDGVLALAGLA